MAIKYKGWLALLLVCCLLCGFTGCSSIAGNYEVLGAIDEPIVSPTPGSEFDFSTTLRLLYPASDAVVVAYVSDVTETQASAVAVRVLEGTSLKDDDSFVLHFPEGTLPQEDTIYFLFLERQGLNYTALVDDCGLITVTGDSELAIESGERTSLSAAVSEIDKMQSYIYLPSYFYYYRELDALVQNCSLIVTGTVTEISAPFDVQFYVREPGLEEIINAEASSVTIQTHQTLYGEAEDTIQVLTSDVMLQNTVVAEVYDSPSYTADSIPVLEVGSTYVFFIMDSPAGRHGSYMLFVNPLQGFVPLMSGDILLSMPVNAPFSYSYTLTELQQEIDDILSGDYFVVVEGGN